MTAQRKQRHGYTLIEVMVSLSVLAIGATGVLALQKATLISNVNARNLVIANNIAATWAERLRSDALLWNDVGGVPDLNGDTNWLRTATTLPFPQKVAPTEIPALGAPGADVLGTDLYTGETAASAYCTHLRFRQFSDSTGANPWASLLRVEIRVAWERHGIPMDCATDPADIDAQPDRYGAVYLTTSVLRNTSP